MQVGDILRVTHDYTVAGQAAKNVFFYRVDTLTVSSVEPFAVLDELSSTWETAFGVFATTNTTSVKIAVDNLTDGLEFSEYTTGWTGGRTGAVAPSFIAVNVTLQRDTKITRNGSKRIGGWLETDFSGNNMTLPQSYIDAIEDYCATGYNFIDYDGAGNDCTWSQVIVGRTKNVDGVYEIDLSKINNITGVLVSNLATTQNSRKAPRS